MHSLLNIVVVEDHDALRHLTVEALQERGHRTLGVDSAEALHDLPANFDADLMVIDLNLPGEDGISLTRRLKAAQPDLGIIMVTARNLVSEKTEGYESGADIYLSKPVSVEELTAAVGALSKRIKRRPDTVPAFRLEARTNLLHGPRGQAALTALECAVLTALIRAPGHRLEYWQLLAQTGHLCEATDKVVLEAPTSRLRAKLAAVGAREKPIRSIRQLGYQLTIAILLA